MGIWEFKDFSSFFSIIISKNNATYKIDRKRYEEWTTNEEQNKLVIAFGELKNLTEKLQKLKIHVYPFDLCKAVSGFAKFDIRKNSLDIEPSYLKER
ncbi:MAG: hypothetical protein P8M03_07570 [Flavobacteriaceae bacterium]|nr:hypothetical protein [Flavobacteriaceae bacterium]